MLLLTIAIAPALFLLGFIYIKDKYEREPLSFVLKTYFYGMLIVPVVLAWHYLIANNFLPEASSFSHTGSAIYQAFIEAAIPEEFLKFLVFLLIVYNNKNFDEFFDGIVYAVAISLGFATVENVLYVLQGGVSVGLNRALFAVPAHFMMGITQGFFFGLAKFKDKKALYITLALVSAIIIHGIYDFLLFMERTWLLVVFAVYFYLMYVLAKKQINIHLENSQFKDKSNET